MNHLIQINHINNNKLVFDTFDKAIKLNPDARPIFHSDRGFQYTSKQFKFKLDQVGMIQSMSRVGKCIDNGPMEAFWGTLYGIKFEDEVSISEAIKNYVDFYNNGRFQTKLKGLTLSQFGNSVNPNLLPLVI